MKWRWSISALAAAYLCAHGAANAASGCAGQLSPLSGRISSRAITAADLLGLRDIGYRYPSWRSPSAISVSRDGSKIAFQVRQARPDSNDYCLSMFVVDLHGGGASLVDQGGELIRDRLDFRGLQDFPSGIPTTIRPEWSPDGISIAYLRKDRGTTQVWRAKTTGARAEPITSSAADVLGFRWAADGKSLVYTVRMAASAREAIDLAEGMVGYRFDDRFIPLVRSTPYAADALADESFTIDVTTKAVRPLPSNVRAEPPQRPDRGLPDDALAASISRTGRRAWSAGSEFGPSAPSELWADQPDGAPLRCAYATCRGARALTWTLDGRDLVIQRRGGWGDSGTAIDLWRPGSGPPRPLISTQDLLVDCEATIAGVACLHEAATQPRRLVLVEPSGALKPVFDPNPEFKMIRFGKVDRLEWTNEVGIHAFADLVLPPDHRPGERHPLIVVQYRTGGFLRGGVGDEYPIHLLAQQGYAVLSFDRPADYNRFGGLQPKNQSPAPQPDGWANRRSIESALQGGIDLAISRGVIDTQRIGITGLSDGTSTANFSLIHGNRYAAAIMSSCCEGPTSIVLGGLRYKASRKRQGWPMVTDYDNDLWKSYALARNAAKVQTPILMQMSDDEYLSGLEAYLALREHHRPVELYVFPNEHHFKWQPAHRAAVYRRTVAWFDFWLRDRETEEYGRAEEYAHWRALKAEAATAAK